MIAVFEGIGTFEIPDHGGAHLSCNGVEKIKTAILLGERLLQVACQVSGLSLKTTEDAL